MVRYRPKSRHQKRSKETIVEHIKKTSPSGRKLRSYPVVVIPASNKRFKIGTPTSIKLSKIAAPTSKTEHSTLTHHATTMADNPSATNPAAPCTIFQHFANAQEARHHLNEDAPKWTPPSEHPDQSRRPTTPSGEYAYVRAAVHSISVGLQDAAVAYTSDPTANLTDFAAYQTRCRVEARAWLLFEALKRLHDGGCTLRYTMDFSDHFGGELRDRELKFRERWVAVCKLLQRFRGAAGMVASGSTEEILEAYVAAPLAMGRKMEEDERLASEGREEKKMKLAPMLEPRSTPKSSPTLKPLLTPKSPPTPKPSPTLKRLPPINPSSSDEQEAREEKKRKLNLEPLASDDLAESSEDEEMKAREAFFDLLLKNYV